VSVGSGLMICGREGREGVRKVRLRYVLSIASSSYTQWEGKLIGIYVSGVVVI